MTQADLGLIGLGVMGQNLALNIERNGYTVAVYNRTPGRTESFADQAAGKRIIPAWSVAELVSLLEPPRQVILMVQAGSAVDAVVEQLLPYLSAGDIIMDGGNSHFGDTQRRYEWLDERGIHLLGVGISGGEEGALKGPSIMPGGSVVGWQHMGPMLESIAAEVDGQPCCTYLGPGGVGHFVKMVHNGIEYADMQLIAEAYFIMKEALGLSASQTSAVFAEWNELELQSYLVEITARILEHRDDLTGRPLVEMILDEAAQKGTGRWTVQEALALGAPVPTIAEAVFARNMSAQKEERVIASALLRGPEGNMAARRVTVQDIEDALYAAKICAYAQGFTLLQRAAQEHQWELDLGQVALIWRGGCIIRARFLDRINEAYAQEPALQNLLLAPYFREAVAQRQAGWRRAVAVGAERGVPVPGLSSALSYFDSYRRARLPASLLQAQRDYFGAHTYRRTDREGTFHTEWTREAE